MYQFVTFSQFSRLPNETILHMTQQVQGPSEFPINYRQFPNGATNNIQSENTDAPNFHINTEPDATVSPTQSYPLNPLVLSVSSTVY